jgi:hypothetical protein
MGVPAGSCRVRSSLIFVVKEKEPIASLSRKAQLQPFSWQVLFEQRVARPLVPVDPALEALIAF